MAIQQIVAAMWPAKNPRPVTADQHSGGDGERGDGVDDHRGRAGPQSGPCRRPARRGSPTTTSIATAQATSSTLDTSVDTASGVVITVAPTNALGGA